MVEQLPLQWLDEHPTHFNRAVGIRLLIELASRSGEIPRSLFIEDAKLENPQYPYTGGAFADVYRGTWDGKRVAVKRLRVMERGKARDATHRVSSMIQIRFWDRG
jgi:hypothetical protein